MKKLIATGAIFFLAGSAVTTAVIAEPALAADTATGCTLPTGGFAAIQAIQNDPTLTPAQELSQELALRKQLLGATLACATQEAKNLQMTLNAVATTDRGTTMQSQLSGKLDDALNFYGIESAKLDGSGINGTQSIAKEMVAWREANFVPLEGDINNFILWSENQGLFTTAENRLTQTKRILSFIENIAPTNGNLDADLQAAQSSLNDAEDENAAAATAIAQIQPPDETLALIQQSLQSLADSYQKFSTLNKLIQVLLPTASSK